MMLIENPVCIYTGITIFGVSSEMQELAVTQLGKV